MNAIQTTAFSAWKTRRFMPSLSALTSIMAMAILSSVLAKVVFIPMIVEDGPTRVVSVSCLISLFSMAWGALFLAEPVGAARIFGGQVVLLAMTLVLPFG